MWRFLLGFLLVVSCSFSLPACNTTKGVGQDMQSGGQSIEKSAKEHGANGD